MFSSLMTGLHGVLLAGRVAFAYLPVPEIQIAVATQSRAHARILARFAEGGVTGRGQTCAWRYAVVCCGEAHLYNLAVAMSR